MQQGTAHPLLAGKARRRLMFCVFCGRHIGSRLPRIPAHKRTQRSCQSWRCLRVSPRAQTSSWLCGRFFFLTEAERSRYWQARRRYRTLSDSNSEATTEKRTQEFEEAKARVLECMNMNTNSLLERERGEKRKLEEEVRRLKQRLAGAGLPHAGE